jgi:hypothetical protein
MAAAARMRRYESKDRLLGLLGPVSLLALLGAWLLLFLLGYALMLLPLTGDGFMAALRLSGSSLFTLGLASSPRQGATVVSFAAAPTGLVVVALQVGYLPTIYGAYNRRETVVNMLESRAGEPAWGVELLAREHLIGGLDSLGPFFTDWERWAADLTESHVNYPWLLSFRSPYPLRSWVVSHLAVLDAAALYLALVPSQAPPAARHCLRTGFLGCGRWPACTGSSCPTTLGRTRRSCSPTRSSPTGWTAWRRSGSRWSSPRRRPGATFAAGGSTTRRPPTCSPTGWWRCPRPGRGSGAACACALTSRWCRSVRATAAPTTPRAAPTWSRRGPSRRPSGPSRPIRGF